ncbi:MAG: ice-binding family protein [Deltaproteobacteria bacterium]
MLCVLLSLAACGDNLGASLDGGKGDSSSSMDGTNAVKPIVVSTLPAANATDVAVNAPASATFSLPMDRTSLSSAFTLTTELGNTAISGTVIMTGATAVFWPSVQLANNTAYIATISTAAKSVDQVALAAKYTWKFTTGVTVAPGQGVNLGAAGDFVLLAKSGIVDVPTSMIVGDLGVSPITSTAITGMPLTPDSSLQFSTTQEVTGRIYAPDYAAPTPTMLTTAVSDMETAFVDAAGRAPNVTELGAGMIGTTTLVPGVYKWSSALNITTSIILDGSATDVWIFQIAQGLTLSTGTQVTLTGGAVPANVFWQASGEVIVNTGAHLEGNVLTMTAATLDTGGSLNGRLLAQTLVTVRKAIIRRPGL